MIMNFSQIRTEELPEVPVSSKMEVLVRDGRTFSDFALFLIKAQEFEARPDRQLLSGGCATGGVELLQQLL